MPFDKAVDRLYNEEVTKQGCENRALLSTLTFNNERGAMSTLPMPSEWTQVGSVCATSFANNAQAGKRKLRDIRPPVFLLLAPSSTAHFYTAPLTPRKALNPDPSKVPPAESERPRMGTWGGAHPGALDVKLTSGGPMVLCKHVRHPPTENVTLQQLCHLKMQGPYWKRLVTIGEFANHPQRQLCSLQG